MISESWPTPEPHRTGQTSGVWRRWALTLLVVALAAHLLLACQATPPSPPPSSTPLPTPTLAPERPRATLGASVAPSRSLPPTASPSPTWAPTLTPTEEAPTGDAATLGSLRQVDSYPLYTMHYYGSYDCSTFQEKGARRASGAMPPKDWACSLFAALGDGDHRLYGRNFDWRYSPALLLFTDPPDGYASLSMVDIAYLIDPADLRALTELPLKKREPLLAAPLWPFDGMNEHGLAIGMAAVPESEMPYDPQDQTIDSLGIIREILDHARSVDEAIAVLGSYNVTWDGGPPLHYLIADAAGRSMLVEYSAGEMVLIPSPGGSPWHLATNHLRAPLADGSPSGCWRYDAMRRRLADAGGALTVDDAVDLLADVSQENTQWSVVYDMTGRGAYVAMGRAYERLHAFRLDLEGN